MESNSFAGVKVDSHSRRHFLRMTSFLVFVSLLPKEVLRAAAAIKSGEESSGHLGNFRTIFDDPKLKSEFLLFLENVYHLYPEKKFHKLIEDATQKFASDEKIYQEILIKVPEIKPFLSEVFYALPALKKQKLEMARQTVELLGEKKSIEGYVEIGTPGRYVSSLQDHVKMSGKVMLVHDWEPSFSPQDIAERGQFSRAGDYYPLGNYDEWKSELVKPESFDVITNFIGLHHSPPEKLDGFVKSIHRTLKPGGVFILRDHDAHSPQMQAMVALAHDVFNVGLGLPWSKNQEEIRHFKSLVQIKEYLAQMGFRHVGSDLYQQGDPTKNALMKFLKV